MANGQLDNVVHHLRHLVAAQGADKPSDHELLGTFVQRQDEAAFAVLVQRHGTLVLNVCRRVLKHDHDAEDACQATFLVLARRASSIKQRQYLGTWLYRVAYRIAASLKMDLDRMRLRTEPVGDVTQADTTEEVSWREVRAVLDEELNRLPEHFQSPLTLCYIEGKTRDEAALQLGWSLGTLRGRLERGRELLRSRLARRGLGLSAALLAAMVSQNAACGLVPASLVVTIVKAALLFAGDKGDGAMSVRVTALAEGVMQTMILTRQKIAAVLVIASIVLAAGTGAATYTSLAGQPALARETDTHPVRPVSNAVEPSPNDLGKENLQFFQEANDQAKPGLHAIAAPGRPTPSPAHLYELAVNGKTFVGSQELIGRLPGPRSVSDRLEVVDFQRMGNLITALVKHVYSPEQFHVNKVFYLRAMLPELPPGRYSVRILFVDYHREGDKVVPAPATQAPEFAPLTCTFSVPAVPAPKPQPIPEEIQQLIDVATERAGKGHPPRPEIGEPIRRGAAQELVGHEELKHSYRKLDAKRRNVEWFEGIEELRKARAVWCLGTGLCHPHVDVQIKCARALGQIKDTRPAPFLLTVARSCAVLIGGSENATLHGILQHALADALNAILGTAVKLKNGQDPEGLEAGIAVWQKALDRLPPQEAALSWRRTLGGSAVSKRVLV